jgi:hypothetical protein
MLSQKLAYRVVLKTVNNLPSVPRSLMNEKAQFKAALKRYVNIYSFHSVDEFLLFEKK